MTQRQSGWSRTLQSLRSATICDICTSTPATSPQHSTNTVVAHAALPAAGSSQTLDRPLGFKSSRIVAMHADPFAKLDALHGILRRRPDAEFFLDGEYDNRYGGFLLNRNLSLDVLDPSRARERSEYG